MKLSRRNAAERHASDPVLPGQLQAGTVAGGQQLPVSLRHRTVDDWSDGMENVIAGQIVGGRELGLPSGFLMPLLFHQFRAGQPELNARIGVNGIPYP